MFKFFQGREFMSWDDYKDKISSMELFLWQQSVFRNELKV